MDEKVVKDAAMSEHCPGCKGYHVPSGAIQPFPRCPGIQCPACAAKDAALAVGNALLRSQEAEIARLRSLVATGREMANVGDGMAAMFEAHWLVKDTDDEVKNVVRLWLEAQAKWRSLDTEAPCSR